MPSLPTVDATNFYSISQAASPDMNASHHSSLHAPSQPTTGKNSPPISSSPARELNAQSEQRGLDTKTCIVGDVAVFDAVPRDIAMYVQPRPKSAQDYGTTTKDLEKQIKDVSKHVLNVRTSFQGVSSALLEVGYPKDVRKRLNMEWTSIVTVSAGISSIIIYHLTQ